MLNFYTILKVNNNISLYDKKNPFPLLHFIVQIQCSSYYRFYINQKLI